MSSRVKPAKPNSVASRGQALPALSDSRRPDRFEIPPEMDLNKVLEDFRAERDRLSHLILTLERLAAHAGRRRGRAPAWLAKLHQADPAPKRKATRPGKTGGDE